MNLNKRCVCLYSGGLDSLLACVFMKSLNFEVFPLFIETPFYTKDKENLKKQLEPFGLRLFTKQNNKAYLEMLLAPRFGYGKNINPCIDCKIFFYKQAKAFLKEVNASFVVTGEVIGQRPMSQRSYTVLRTIEKHAGLSDMVLRPLSAKCLPDTEMEKQKLIDKGKLYCIQGRSRQKQFELARQLGIENFESPAGGCHLTDPIFAIKLKDLINNNEIFNEDAIRLLYIGRHFRINGYKFIVSRNESETKKLLEEFGYLPLIKCINKAGAAGVFLKNPDYKTIETAAKIVKRYSKKADLLMFEGNKKFVINTRPIEEKGLELLRIGGRDAS